MHRIGEAFGCARYGDHRWYQLEGRHHAYISEGSSDNSNSWTNTRFNRKRWVRKTNRNLCQANNLLRLFIKFTMPVILFL